MSRSRPLSSFRSSAEAAGLDAPIRRRFRSGTLTGSPGCGPVETTSQHLIGERIFLLLLTDEDLLLTSTRPQSSLLGSTLLLPCTCGLFFLLPKKPFSLVHLGLNGSSFRLVLAFQLPPAKP